MSEDDDQDDDGYCATSNDDELVTLSTPVNYIIVITVISYFMHAYLCQ